MAQVPARMAAAAAVVVTLVGGCSYRVLFWERNIWQDTKGIFAMVEPADLELYRELLPAQFTVPDQQRRIYDNTIRWAASLDLVVTPVGWVWYDVLSDGPPIHYLHSSDWNHPSLRGSYLSASVIFSTVSWRALRTRPTTQASNRPKRWASSRSRPALSWTRSSSGVSIRTV